VKRRERRVVNDSIDVEVMKRLEMLNGFLRAMAFEPIDVDVISKLLQESLGFEYVAIALANEVTTYGGALRSAPHEPSRADHTNGDERLSDEL